MKKQEHNDLLDTLKTRFERNPQRHPGLQWSDVLARLEGNRAALKTLHAMEATGGKPDVIGHDPHTGRVTFCDCARETPTGRRSLCYDRAALDARKENKPQGNALDMATEMGVALLTEEQYRELQALEAFDLKTSSWLATPPEVRALGGAIFGDCRYGRVFIYHNGVQSYYAARGFRGMLSL
ncbi:DUF4256 domain-containing protein [Pseudomonas sp. 21TX0197]|uniref:DUF4256 domain-containing protein n=1 Tax=unclassified Pseudomonas TaxID=196821 RepID=UPI00090FC640|nr:MULTISPECIES: DUF4256 domain-containing protein [unclassified Pseudomonas]MDB6442984.1 DUF4256 domain-containing protein [Pseudomonas sp. 21TX0197]ROO38316.1 hypothetical protein BIV09_14920 [Pseudomonas sp. 7SR1]SFX50984.1 Protein of unknown function [Pseudomonas sp. NFACC49-2]SIR91146.1 Protein of unknown function [Pseudomonas sp. 7SR1]